MKQNIAYAIIAFVVLFQTACIETKVEIIDCPTFALTGEKYWFAENKNTPINFQTDDGQTKTFIITDKSIHHRTQINAKAGCSCSENSGILLLSGNDSIWAINRSSYTDPSLKTNTEVVVFVINGTTSIFYESDLKDQTYYNIGDKNFSNIKKYTYNYNTGVHVQTVYMAKDYGIIRVEFSDGKSWTLSNLALPSPVTIESFSYTEDQCN
ncbi:MAG: hypothetical protein RIS47_895 [Bacteroidota bacterium]|jgi:flagellin-like hook-associated protein FlgL